MVHYVHGCICGCIRLDVSVDVSMDVYGWMYLWMYIVHYGYIEAEYRGRISIDIYGMYMVHYVHGCIKNVSRMYKQKKPCHIDRVLNQGEI